MIVRTSSTASPVVGVLGGPLESVVGVGKWQQYHGGGLVPLIGTDTITIGSIFSQDIETAADTISEATYRYAAPSGWLVVSSPSGGLTTSRPTIDLVKHGAGMWITCQHTVRSAADMATLTVTGLSATVEAGNVHGLLNSTDSELDVSVTIQSKFAEATALAEQEWFEDGVESSFSRVLSLLLHAYGSSAVARAEVFVRSPASNTEIVFEVARWLGAVNHEASHYYRKAILEHLLGSASPRIRHGAAAGLAAMNDPRSLPAMRRSRDQEHNRRLRTYLELAVEQLERTRACRNS